MRTLSSQVERLTLKNIHPKTNSCSIGAQYSSSIGEDVLSEHNRPKSPSKMTQSEQWGIQGLLETLRHPNTDKAAMAAGHDLTLLGLDLNSSEYLLHSTHYLCPLRLLTDTAPSGLALARHSHSFHLVLSLQTIPFLLATMSQTRTR